MKQTFEFKRIGCIAASAVALAFASMADAKVEGDTDRKSVV